MSKNLERLSSGYRINRAADDVAGLAISENMRAQITGLNQAVKNAQDGNSLLQTAEGSLNEVHTMLQRMRELAVQSANGTLQPEDRTQIQTEMDNLAKEVTRITNATQFNSKDLLDGSLQLNGGMNATTGLPNYNTGGIDQVSLQIGPNAGQTVAFSIGAMDAKSLGISRDVQTAQVFSDDAAVPVNMVQGGGIVGGVAATGAVGAGVTAGIYQVKYDAAAKTVQLFDNATTPNAIGTAVSVVDASGAKLSSVTIGDKNTAQTITIDLKGTITGTTDYLSVGSRVAAVTSAGNNIDTTAAGQTGIVSVGWGLAQGDYTVTFNAGMLQLSGTGGNIGSAVAFAANKAITLGDASTGRTLTILTDGAGAGSDTVKVLNNGEAAENAKFTQGVKYGSSQAFAGLNVSSVTGAQAAITAIDAAIGKVSYQRSQMGAIQNRLDHTVNNLQVVSENLTASESRIRDVDMAMEMTQFTKHQILMQSGTAMLAQANQKNQAVLSLLR
jgi:flagellin